MKTAAKPTPGPRTSRGGLGLREGVQRREDLREGVPIQRRPGTLLALGRCRWPIQMKTAAKPTPGPRTSRGGLGLREVDQRREGLREGVRSSAGRLRPGALLRWPVTRVEALPVERCQDQPAGLREGVQRREDLREGVPIQRRPGAPRGSPGGRPSPAPAGFALGRCSAGRSPGGSPLRGAGSGSTGRLGLWPVQVKTAAKPTPGPRTSRGGLGLREVDQRREGLREGVQVQRRQGSPWGSAAGHWPGVPWSGARINRPGSGRVSSAARTFGRVSRSSAGRELREGLREGVQVQRRTGSPSGAAARRWPVQVEALPVDLREGLREGVPVQRRPGTLLALGRCRWPVQIRRPPSRHRGLEPAAAGLGSGRLTSAARAFGKVSRSSAGRVRPGALPRVTGRVSRGAVPGSTGRAPRG